MSAVDASGRTIWIVDAHRGDGKRFIVRADEKLTAFLELESAIIAGVHWPKVLYADRRKHTILRLNPRQKPYEKKSSCKMDHRVAHRIYRDGSGT